MRGVNTKSKEKLKKILTFFLLLVLLMLLGNSVRRVYIKKNGAEQALARMKAEIEDLKSRQESLEQFASRVETSDGVEFELRKKFNVAGNGEKVAIFVDESNASSTQKKSQSIWSKIKGWFE